MKKHHKKAPPALVFQSSEDDEKILAELLKSLPPILQEEEPAPLAFKKTKKSRLLLKSPDATLDLHGKTREEALQLVENFIVQSHQKRLQAVVVVTGKGYRSGRKGPVLNQVVRDWLKEKGAAWVRNVRVAPPKHGGTGALLIHLK